MERSWWWKFLLFGGVTVLAALYLVPSVVPEEKQPGFIKGIFTKKIQQGLDLQGGIHLVYEVNVDKAVASKVDRLANDIEDRLREKTNDFTVSRDGRDSISIDFDKAEDAAYVDNDLLQNYRGTLYELERSGNQVVIALEADQVAEVQEYALRQGIETIRGRVDQFGVAEPTIIKRGTDIIIELPGKFEGGEFERIKGIIGRTAQLEFKIYDDESEYMKKVAASVEPGSGIEVDVDQWRADKTNELHEAGYLVAPKRADLEAFVAGLSGELAVPSDREFGYEEISVAGSSDTAEKETRWRTYLLERRSVVTGEYLSDAQLSFDQQTNRPEVAFEMDRQGATLMARLTSENIGRRMAVVLDGTVKSAPTIQSEIAGRGRITLGSFGDPIEVQKEAQDLVAVLRSGALPAPLSKSFETQVGPTLGKDVVDKSAVAMGLGAVAVVLFMLLYYRRAGIVANVAMFLNGLFMLAILAAFEAALTLPGIAGLVLAVGMAVDANIIIYERIREELRAGRSARAAVDAGFSRAFWTVFDAHVTNFVAGIVLYSYGSGPIRGFAVTLLVGILSNLLTAVWMSRWMFEVFLGRRGDVKQTLSI